MKRKFLFLFLFLILFFFTYRYIIKDFERTEDTIYTNASIITLNKKQPFAQAMLIKNGIIEAVGSNKEITKLKTTEPIVDLKGATILPGFIDSHTHVALSSFSESMIDLSGFKHKTNEQVWNHLKNVIKTKKAGEWIVCKGIDPILVEDLVTPNITFLDKIAPKNPIILISQSLHTYWANSNAFEKVGITKDTKDPSKTSYYEKDKNGNLTGLIAEQEAFIPILEQLKKKL